MSSLPKYTDISSLRYVKNTYTVPVDVPAFEIPFVNADRRIVDLTIEWEELTPTLQLRLPERWEPYQKLTLNLSSPIIQGSPAPIRELNIVRKNSPQSITRSTVARTQESEGEPVSQLHFTSGQDGRWMLDYSFDPALERLAQITTLVVSNSLESGVNGDYNLFSNYNGKPQFVNNDLSRIIRYSTLDGWGIINSDTEELVLSGVGNEFAVYPWEVIYNFNTIISPSELSQISLKSPLYPDIEVFGTGSLNGVYTAVKTPSNISSDIPVVYAKENTNFYLFKDATDTWVLMNGASLVTAARKPCNFPWETSYNSTSTVITRLDQIYASPLSFQITSPITELIDARRLTEISVSNMAVTSNPSTFILPGFQGTANIFKGGAVTGDVVIINHTQSAQDTTMEVRIPVWTGSGYTGTLNTLLTINKTGRWVFRFSGGTWSTLAVAQHTHSVGDLTQSGATAGQVIKWNGTVWAPGDDTGGSGGEMVWGTVPASATSTGTAGQMAYADNYLYVCVAPNVWKRTILATW